MKKLSYSSLCLTPKCLSRCIWLIGGTQESVQLADAIAHLSQMLCIVSVTTETAKALYPPTPNLQVWVERLTTDRVQDFLQQQQIVAILDASHPYAVEISKSAIAAARKQQIPYLRYERPSISQQFEDSGTVIELDNFDMLLAGEYLADARVLLTVGYRPLELFSSWQQRSTLFARILPSAIALEAAYIAGFTPERLICLRPPVSAELETALWQHWEISVVVTKASGIPGGEDIKRIVAAKLGATLIVINRPALAYPQQTSDLSVALEFCHQQLLF